MLSSAEFTESLIEQGHDFVTGVPCSLLTPLIDAFAGDARWQYFSAANEGLAMGLAVGATLGGRKPVVFMQNSGLGNSIDALTSLTSIQKTPVLLLISWRGEPGTGDEPQHDEMGRLLLPMLRLLGVSFGILDVARNNTETLLSEADTILRSGNSFAIIIKKNSFEPQVGKERRVPSRLPGLVEHPFENVPANAYPTRLSAVDMVQETAPASAGIITSTGKMSRELLMLNDGPRNLYVVGSMGLASMVGLGVSLSCDRKIIVLDGDGSVLMQMGALAMMGSYGNSNLVHVILDNGVHDSTGGQETIAKNVRFAVAAANCGFVQTFETTTPEDFKSALERALDQTGGPVCIHAHVAPGSLADLPRPEMSPADNQTRFRDHLLQDVCRTKKAAEPEPAE